jgi:hypothetical protein
MISVNSSTWAPVRRSTSTTARFTNIHGSVLEILVVNHAERNIADRVITSGLMLGELNVARKCPRIPQGCVRCPQRCAWDAGHGGDLGLRARGVAGEPQVDRPDRSPARRGCPGAMGSCSWLA